MISLSCYKINGFLFYCYYVLCFFLDFWVGSFSLFSVSVVETKLIWLWHNGIRLITCSINFGWVTHEAYLCVYCLIYSFAEYFFFVRCGLSGEMVLWRYFSFFMDVRLENLFRLDFLGLRTCAENPFAAINLNAFTFDFFFVL